MAELVPFVNPVVPTEGSARIPEETSAYVKDQQPRSTIVLTVIADRLVSRDYNRVALTRENDELID